VRINLLLVNRLYLLEANVFLPFAFSLHRTLNMTIMTPQAEALIPTKWGNFRMLAFADTAGERMPHLALIHEKTRLDDTVLIRIHSECITGDLFGSHRCDCGEQLNAAMELIAQEGGIIIYLRQEGRGIGIINKLKAYNLQDLGLNTVDANIHLGLEVDSRDYRIAIDILKALNINKVKLLTNNPDKIESFEHSDIQLIDRVPLIINPREENLNYLKTKQEAMGHLL
jgi:GTP cyclohydrolase II